MTHRPETTVTADAPAVALSQPSCCGRPMSTISVTEDATELSLLSCASCSRHAWLQDGALLDRDQMLAAVRERLAVAPRPKGGRPKGSGRKSAAATAVPAPRTEPDAQRTREIRQMLQGFRVLGE